MTMWFLRAARISPSYRSNTQSLCVRRTCAVDSGSNGARSAFKASRSVSSAPRSTHALRVRRAPPRGFTPRTRGLSVWRPTTTSSSPERSVTMYPGSCDVMPHALETSKPRHPPRSYSCFNRSWQALHSLRVFSVGPLSSEKRSPSTGQTFAAMNDATSVDLTVARDIGRSRRGARATKARGTRRVSASRKNKRTRR